MKRRIFTFMLVPALSGSLATILYFAQGGFGAGHGAGDFLIGLFGLPSILFCILLSPVITIQPLPGVVWESDLLQVIGLPALMNLCLFALAGFISGVWFPDTDTWTKTRKPGIRFLRSSWCIVLGWLCEAAFAVPLLNLLHDDGVYQLNQPVVAVQTMLFLVGITGGLILIFMGCIRLSNPSNGTRVQ